MTQRNDGNESIFPQKPTPATPLKKILSPTSCWNNSTSENLMTVDDSIFFKTVTPQGAGMTRQVTIGDSGDSIFVPLYLKKKKKRGGVEK